MSREKSASIVNKMFSFMQKDEKKEESITAKTVANVLQRKTRERSTNVVVEAAEETEIKEGGEVAVI